jgi:predicted transcriptional regulator
MTTFEQLKQELQTWANPEGVSASVILQLSNPLRGTLSKIIRQGCMTFTELAGELKLSEAETDEIAELLVECGFLKTVEENADGEAVYMLRHPKTTRPEAPIAVWKMILDDFIDEEKA